jgi:hypothetical protein
MKGNVSKNQKQTLNNNWHLQQLLCTTVASMPEYYWNESDKDNKKCGGKKMA